jgi:hypothetical protein
LALETSVHNLSDYLHSSAEETGNRLETLTELTREHREEARVHYDKTEDILEEVNGTILAQNSHAEKAIRG